MRLRATDPTEKPRQQPEYFDGRYILPQHSVYILEIQNHHTRDDRIKFYENHHIYCVDGFPAHESISSMVKEFRSEFNPQEAIANMKFSQTKIWPRLEYVHNARKVNDFSKFKHSEYGFMIVHKDTNITLAAIHPGTSNSAVERFSIQSEQEQYYVFDRVLTDSEICEKWAQNGQTARNQGIEAHHQMELWFNSKAVRLYELEMQIGLAFVRKYILPLQAKAYRTEWAIFGDHENVAGCIDLALKLPDGRLYLIDWKRSQNLKSKMYNTFKSMKPPLDHLEDCDGCAYALQLSGYRFFCWRNAIMLQ